MFSHKLAVIAPQIGAISETFIRKHMEELLPNQTIVIAGNNDPPYSGHWDISSPKLILNKIRKRGLHWKTYYKILGLIGDKIEIRKAKKFLRKHKVKVILSEYLDLSLPWLSIANELGIPFYAHAHGYDISVRLQDPFWRCQYLKLNDATGLITPSQYSCHKLIELGIDEKKIKVIPCGIKVPSQARVPPENEIIRCLAVGRMVQKKSPLSTLKGFHNALKNCPNLHLDYVGDGPLLSEVKKYVDDFDLNDKVTLYGAQSNNQVQALMKKSDIFLQHSVTDPETGDQEGLPVAILEAMSNALPIVSTRHAGIPEAVEDGKNGFLVDEYDTSMMTTKIIELAKDNTLRRKMAYSSWHKAYYFYSWNREKKSLIQMLGLVE